MEHQSSEEWSQYQLLRQSPTLQYSSQERCFYAAKYSDVEYFLRTDSVTVDFPFRASRQVFGKTILDSDDENQIQIKKNLTPFFTRKAVEHYREVMIRPIIRTILEESRQCGEVIDYNYWVAQRIPTQIIMAIFGIDLVHERYLYAHLEKLVLYIDHPSNSLEEANNSREELMSFLRKFINCELPSDPRGLLASLDKSVYADENELLRTCLMLLTAGMATTIASLNTLLLYTFEHADYLAGILEDAVQLRRFVEEVIRVEPPLHATIRFVKKDFDYNDVNLKRNDMLKIILASANHDEHKYEAPDALNLHAKKDASCTFGKGKHACIGADLAVTELVVFVQEMLPSTKLYDVKVSDADTGFEGNVIKMFRQLQLVKK
jgi:cytochrome P450